jgi:hypothetical protein
MSEKNSLSVLAEHIVLAFEPLKEALASPENFTVFMFELGWDMSQPPEPIRNLEIPLQAVLDIVESGDDTASSMASLLIGIKSLVNSIHQLSTYPDGLFPASVNANEFKSTFPAQLVHFLIIEYLLDQAPAFGSILKVLGVIRIEEVDATATRPAHISLELAWQDLANVFDDPFIALKNAYQWGTAGFKAIQVIENFLDVAEAFGIDIRFQKPEATMESFLTQDAISLEDVHNRLLCAPIIEDNVSGVQLKLGVCLFMLPKTSTEEAGFAILPYGSGQFDEEMELSETLVLAVEVAIDLSGGIALLVRPNKDIELLVDIISSVQSGTAPPSSGAMAIALKTQNRGDARTVLIGSDTGSRLEFASVSTKAGVQIDSLKQLDAYIEFELKDGGIIIDAADDADSFLSSLLPREGMSIDFSFLIGFSTGQGCYFGGSGGLEVSLPIHIDLGPIEIVSSTLAVKVDSGVVLIDLGATIKGELGPLKTVVENMGLQASFAFPTDQTGNLGPVDLVLGYKPPMGVGISLDAGVVKGGGYLFFDVNREEYAGALELVFSGFINVKAIGLISTRMPDGSRDFSLLIIITAEFGTGIQLGFGFTLLGVGGLLGLNRTIRLQPLMERVRTGTITNIMFPRNVVANAPRIISDLRTIFPPQSGTFLIGPMAKVGWGTPTLISLSLGIIIEIPGNIVILGVLRVALPTADAPLILLQVAFAGAIEFDKKRIYFFAVLFESRLLYFPIEGGMGLLVAYGGDPNFVVSVGGFHPSYQPPPLPFPSPQRISFNILNGGAGRITVSGYFAVTTNTVQFGARAELVLGIDDFGIEGHIAFDALIQFSPFYFIIQISASVSLRAFGIGLFSIRLRFALEGPTPWRARGSGSISFLFFSISADFDITWGETRDTTLPPINVMPLLAAEFEKLENWQAQLPRSNNLLVSLRQLEVDPDTLVLHPVGTLRISQRAIPLDLTIDKVGNQRVNDAKRFTVSVASGDFVKTSSTSESFAPAQFQNMEDAQKLSRPAFEPQHAGLELSIQGDQLASAKMVKRIVRYEEVVIDTNFKRFVRRFFLYTDALFAHFLRGASINKSSLSQTIQQQLQPFEEKIEVRPNTYVVAFNHNNTAFNGSAVGFDSEAMARDYMQQQIDQDPNLAESLHVIPAFEMN